MFKSILFCMMLLSLSLFGSNKAFEKDIEKYLEKDFSKFGITYNSIEDKIIFKETEMLFHNGKSNISIPLSLILEDFFPKYLKLLMKHKINIKKVIIKGHTSSANYNSDSYKRKFELNQILSQKRADNFLNYVKSIDNDIVNKNSKWIENFFTAQGMSYSDLIYDKYGKEDSSASKRIEIQIIFNKDLKYIKKSSEMIISSFSGTKKLPDYVRALLDDNPSLNEKYNVLKSFESDIRIAKAAFYPVVSLNYKYTDYSESDNFTDIQSKDITIRYNIFNGFQDLEETNIRKYTYKMNQYLNEQVEGDLIYSLVESFINIKKQKDILALAQANLNDYDLWISKEDIKFQNGMNSLRIYAKVQSRDTTQRMNYKELTKQYKDNISTFRRYLDFSEKDIDNFETLHPTSQYIRNKDIAYSDMKIYSPYLKEAKKIVEIYKEKLEQSKVNFYPTINLIAKKSILDENYEVASTITTDETSIALEASLELYSGGSDRANNEKKLFEYKAKVSKKEDVIRAIKYKLDLAFNKYELTIEKNTLLESLIKKCEDSFLGATYDYKFNKIDANELLDHIDDLYNARKMYIENKYDKLLSQYNIINVVGVIKNNILDQEIKE